MKCLDNPEILSNPPPPSPTPTPPKTHVFDGGLSELVRLMDINSIHLLIKPHF